MRSSLRRVNYDTSFAATRLAEMRLVSDRARVPWIATPYYDDYYYYCYYCYYYCCYCYYF